MEAFIRTVSIQPLHREMRMAKLERMESVVKLQRRILRRVSMSSKKKKEQALKMSSDSYQEGKETEEEKKECSRDLKPECEEEERDYQHEQPLKTVLPFQGQKHALRPMRKPRLQDSETLGVVLQVKTKEDFSKMRHEKELRRRKIYARNEVLKRLHEYEVRTQPERAKPLAP